MVLTVTDEVVMPAEYVLIAETVAPWPSNSAATGSRSVPTRGGEGCVIVQVESLDHLVLTVGDLDAALEFYSSVLGMRVVTFGENRKALAFGRQKINLHLAGRELEPKAAVPVPGSADLCFLTVERLENVVDHLRSLGVPVIQGPVRRTGATGPIRSVYIRDPDGNLIEIANREMS
jgi:catechol 2,3-dioxygenase-like lactoylglutathione lyase family enzyme